MLGVDPGLTRCGVGVVEGVPGRMCQLVMVDVITTDPSADLAMRLLALDHALTALVAEFQPGAVAVERVFSQHNVRTVMGTAQASGVALLIAGERGLPAQTHTPTEVKAAITGYGSADKRQVQAMVARILRLDELPKPADAADALALALCHAWRTGVGAAPASGGALTPAQRAWQDAERLARR